jgi:hypothetical protein
MDTSRELYDYTDEISCTGSKLTHTNTQDPQTYTDASRGK